MNFFEHQNKARRKTWLLVVYFLLAIVLVIIAINGAFYLVLAQTVTPTPPLSDWLAKPYWIWIAIGTLIVIGVGSLYNMFMLRRGGTAVVEMVGARRVNPSTCIG